MTGRASCTTALVKVVTPLVFLLGGELLNSFVISSLNPLVYLLYYNY